MIRMRKILSAFLSLFVIVSYMSIANASVVISTNDRAAILNSLKILNGDGSGNYHLDLSLKRSEAVTFIVRLMGKEGYVQQNTASLCNTKFNDIKSTLWYAPYVGYCGEQGIIAGDNKGDFNPDVTITEKEFLKLVLVALGYVYTNDFSWSNVYSTAYHAGIVTDPSYLTKTADNNKYTRLDVVNVLYNAVTKTSKGTNVTMLQNLINSNVITADQAIATGIISKDDSSVAISNVLALSKNSVWIQFSKDVADIDIKDISIYASSDSSKKLDISIKAKQTNSILINTSDQASYADYTFKIINVKASAGVLSTELTGTFSGFRADVVTSDFFKISKVDVIDKDSLNLYFTHPLNINSSNANYYEILDKDGATYAAGSAKSLIVQFTGSPNNMVTISLQGTTFKAGEKYTLKVSGDLSSLYSVKLNDGQGDQVRFTASSSSVNNTTSNTTLQVTGINLLDYRTLQISFNMQVHPLRAQQISSYYITDNYGNYVPISKAAVGGSGDQAGKVILLSISGSFIKANNYNIIINEIDDITKQYSIEGQTYNFSGAYPDRSALGIKGVSAIDKNTIVVQFDRSLDSIAAVTKEYYLITCPSIPGYSAIPDKVMFDSTGTDTVRLYLPSDKALTANTIYKLTVLSLMKDNLGNIAGLNRDATFTGSGVDGAKPIISDAVIIAKDTIKITTSRDIALDKPNILASNYTLDYNDNGTIITLVPLIVGYINSTTLILKFDALDFSKSYTLKFSSLVDYSGLYTSNASDGHNAILVRLGQ